MFQKTVSILGPVVLAAATVLVSPAVGEVGHGGGYYGHHDGVHIGRYHGYRPDYGYRHYGGYRSYDGYRGYYGPRHYHPYGGDYYHSRHAYPYWRYYGYPSWR